MQGLYFTKRGDLIEKLRGITEAKEGKTEDVGIANASKVHL